VSPAAAATLPANILQSPFHYFQQQQQLHHQQPQQQQHHCSNGRRMLATMSTLMLPTMTATLSAANNGPPMTVAAPPTHAQQQQQQPPKQALQSVDKLVMTAVNHNSAVSIANKMGIYLQKIPLSLLFWLDDGNAFCASPQSRGCDVYINACHAAGVYDNAAFCVWGKLKVRVCIVGLCLCVSAACSAEKVLRRCLAG
jgi:hypothetical protein